MAFCCGGAAGEEGAVGRCEKSGDKDSCGDLLREIATGVRGWVHAVPLILIAGRTRVALWTRGLGNFEDPEDAQHLPYI